MVKWVEARHIALGALLLMPRPALAHPHVWVETRATVLFDSAGLVTGVRNDWVFDEMYSAFVEQGQGKSGAIAPDKLAELAKTNVDSLADYDYFTYAKAGGKKVIFKKPVDYTLEIRADKRLVLHFTLPLEQPVKTGRAMSLQIYDPTFFVDFELAPKDAVALSGAPSGCSQTVLDANPLVVANGQKAAKTFDAGIAPAEDFAMSMASRIIVACP